MALAGQLLKATTDISRFTVDLTEAATYVQAGNYYTGEYGQVAWLGTEVAVRTVAPTVTLGNTSFSLYPPPNVPPADPTPLLIQSYGFLAGSQQLQFFAYSGTPGNTYTVEFVISDNAGRVLTCDVQVIITGNLAIPAPLVPGPAQGALSILGGTMLGPLLLFRDPVLSTEAATKHYADNILAGGITTGSELVVTAGGASITGNVGITGTLTASGALTVSSGGAAITGNSTVVGTLSSGALTITSGGLTATGNGSFTGTLSSGGALTVTTGGASITGTTGITGATTITGVTAIVGNTAVTGTLTSSTTLTVSSGGATITGNGSFTGTLSSGGALTVTTGGAAITGTSTVTGSLAVTGAFTGALRSYLTGMQLSVDGTSPNTVLDIAVGQATDSTNVILINLSSAFTKSTAGVWASGSGSNGMGTGLTIADSTWYHVFAIINAGAADVYFDTSVTAANKPASTTAFRRIGSFLTDGSAHIVSFFQNNDTFMWSEPIIVTASDNPDTMSSFATTMITPFGVVVTALGGLAIGDSTATTPIVYVSTPSTPDVAPSLTNGWWTCVGTQNVASAAPFAVLTNTASSVRMRCSSVTTNIWVTTNGWIDTRGKNV